MARWIKMPLGRIVGLNPNDNVLDGDPSPLPKKAAEPPPQFSAHVYCAQTAGWIKMPLGMEVGLDPSDIALDGYTAPIPTIHKKGGRAPNFQPMSHCLYCGQTAVWIKMPHRMKVGLDPGHIVLDGDLAPHPPKRRHSLKFRPMFVV